jgi:hypothetical protein
MIQKTKGGAFHQLVGLGEVPMHLSLVQTLAAGLYWQTTLRKDVNHV